MSIDDTDVEKIISRRQALQLAGAGTAGVLAGCSGGGGNDSTGNSSNGEGGQTIDATFVTGDIINPSTIQWNEYYVKKQRGRLTTIFDPLATVPNYPQNVKGKPTKIKGFIAKNWSIDEDTLTVNLNNNYTWHDGNNLTARDVVTQFKIEKHLGLSTWDNLANVKTVGKHTVEFKIKNTPVNETVLLSTILATRNITTPHSVYDKYLEKFQNASGKDELEQVKQDFVTTKIEEPIGNGIWKLSEKSPQKITYKPYRQHPVGNSLNYNLEIEYAPQNSQWFKSLAADQYDGTTGVTPKARWKQFPDAVEKFGYPTNQGDAIIFNHKRKPWDNRLVRQAFAYLLDRKILGANSRPVFETPKAITGLPDAFIQEWISDEVQNKYTTYDKDAEKASSLLREAGFSKRNGSWVDSDRKLLEASFLVPSSGTWLPLAETAISQLREFGINGETVVKDKSGFGELLGNGDFDIVVFAWGTTDIYNYYATLQNDIVNWTNAFTGYSYKRKVPMPVGDSSGSLKTVDLQEKLQKLGTAATKKEVSRLLEEITWVYNQDVPKITATTIVELYWLTNDDWKYPQANSSKMMAPLLKNLWRTGELKSQQ